MQRQFADLAKHAQDNLRRLADALEGVHPSEMKAQPFGGKVLRFSDLERAIPAISQKMLAQQLRQLEADGICPALDALLAWSESRKIAPSEI